MRSTSLEQLHGPSFDIKDAISLKKRTASVEDGSSSSQVSNLNMNQKLETNQF